jgi:hypothetical protein
LKTATGIALWIASTPRAASAVAEGEQHQLDRQAADQVGRIGDPAGHAHARRHDDERREDG